MRQFPQERANVKGDPRTAPTRVRSRALRRNASDADGALWHHLRSRQLVRAKFRRQHPIGRYFTDYCCVEARLIIELDGGQHTAQAARDARRTAYLAEQGFRVIRFWNHDVLANPDAVLATIAMELARPV